MHDVPTRQLIALSAALLAGIAAPFGIAEESRQATALEEVQAAKLIQAALAAGAAKPEEWRKLEASYAALAARYPRDVTVIDAHAEFLSDRGEQTRAMAEWKRAEQIEPMNPRILGRLGDSALALGEPRKSAAFYARAVAIDPGNAAAHFSLANVWFLFRHELIGPLGRNEASLLNGALAHFAEAARLAPQNLEYARAYAETFYSIPKPDWPAALDAWEHVQELIPEKDFAFGHLARVYLKMGHLDASRRCLSQMHAPAYEALKARLQAQIDAHQESTVGSPAGRPPQIPGKGSRNSSKPAIDAIRGAP